MNCHEKKGKASRVIAEIREYRREQILREILWSVALGAASIPLFYFIFAFVMSAVEILGEQF